MPKKRFTAQYSKPQSTVHPSLSSASSSSSSAHRKWTPRHRTTPPPLEMFEAQAAILPAIMASTYSPSPKQLRILVRESAERNGYRLLRTDIDFEAELTSPSDNDVQPSVNDLISSLRKSQLSSGPIFSPTTTATPTLPPQIRHLLAQPDTPAPRPRGRQIRRHDASGRRLPAGPAPPQSWLESSRRTLGLRGRGQQRVYPTDVEHLPGLPAGEGKGRRLVDMCLRNIARDWEFIHEYEKYNLVDLPSGLRMALLSVVAVHGPDEGVGFEGLAF
jgi:hypothetical protein